MIRSSFFRWKSASGCDSKVLVDLNLSYRELAIKLNFQPLPVCVFAPVPRNLDEGKGTCTLILFAAELILGLLPALLKLVGRVDNDDSVDRVLLFGQTLSQLTRALIFAFLVLA